jgi:hypothetical protein
LFAILGCKAGAPCLDNGILFLAQQGINDGQITEQIRLGR